MTIRFLSEDVTHETYKQWSYNKTGLIKTIQDTHPFIFITSYGVEQLELVFRMMYNNRIVAESVRELSVLELSKLIVATYEDKWQQLYDETVVEKIPLGVSGEKIVTETGDNKQDKTLTDDTTNNVSAFNDDDVTVNDTSTNSTKDVTIESSNKTITTRNKDYLLLNSQIKELNSNFCISVVCQDIKDFITLDIY